MFVGGHTTPTTMDWSLDDNDNDFKIAHPSEDFNSDDKDKIFDQSNPLFIIHVHGDSPRLMSCFY